jgi:hypothetical protein
MSTTVNIFNPHFHIKFEKNWLQQEGFQELFTIWWNSYIILIDFGEQ